MDKGQIDAMQYKTLLDLSDDLICITGGNGSIRYANSTWHQILGYLPEELFSRSLFDFFHPEDSPPHPEKQGGQDAAACDVRCVHKDGSDHRICWKMQPGPGTDTLYWVGKRNQSGQTDWCGAKSGALRRMLQIETSCDGVAIIDQQHRVIEANERFAQMLGYPVDEVIGLHTWDFEVIMSEAQIRENFSDLTKTDTVFETRHRRKDGSILEVEVSASGSKVDDEALVIVICRDISDRKRAEARLRDSEERLRALSDATFESIFFSDKGVCIDQNLSAEKAFGYSPEEAIGRHGTEWIAHKDRGQVNENMATGYEKPYQVTALRKNGTTFPAEIQARMFEYQGEKIRVTAVRNITERKIAEENLRESEAKFKTIFDASPMAMILVETTEERVVDGNHRFCEWMNRQRTDLVGKKVSQLGFYSDDHRRLMAEEMENFHNINGLPMDFFSPDGEVRSCQVYARILSISGKPHFLAMFADTTEQARLEAALLQARKMEAIGTLAGGIAHEFNNILGVIIGNAELAVDEIAEWNLAASCLEEIRIASLRAKEVVRKILSVARKAQSTKKRIRIGPVVEESMRLLRATIPTTITIHTKILCQKETVLADRTEMDQVLMNLCTNAAHAMKGRAGTLTVSLAPVALDEAGAASHELLAPGEFIRLTVEDTGEGIDPAIKNRIFDPYFTTKNVDEGLGMGLAIVYGIVQKHNGTVTVESQPGEGARVEILLPQTDGPAEEEMPESRGLPTGCERILIVDDEPSIVNISKRLLKRLGYEVVGMTSAEAALKFFQSDPYRFDLVVTDMAMPEISGDRLSVELLRIRPGLPIVLCTGHSDQIDEERALELGIRAYRTKPLDSRDLSETVRQVLDGTDRFIVVGR